MLSLESLKDRSPNGPGKVRLYWPPQFPHGSLFWDQDFRALTWEQDHNHITARILASGGWDAVAWLRARWGDRALREWIESRCGERLRPQQLRFWQLVLGLPARQVDAWLAAAVRSDWENRFPEKS